MTLQWLQELQASHVAKFTLYFYTTLDAIDRTRDAGVDARLETVVATTPNYAQQYVTCWRLGHGLVGHGSVTLPDDRRTLQATRTQGRGQRHARLPAVPCGDRDAL